MQYSKLILLVGLVSISVSSCKQHQEARRPLSQKSGTFMKKSAERNKKLIAGEEGQIDSLIKSNTKIKYLASTKGYWYTYIAQNIQDTLKVCIGLGIFQSHGAVCATWIPNFDAQSCAHGVLV